MWTRVLIVGNLKKYETFFLFYSQQDASSQPSTSTGNTGIGITHHAPVDSESDSSEEEVKRARYEADSKLAWEIHDKENSPTFEKM